MAATLSENSYGKQAVRLVRVHRGKKRHHLQDVTVAIRCAGKFAAAYKDGDNREVLPTDTMKNTVYALAAEHPFDDVEEFGLLLTAHFLQASRRAAKIQVDLAERLWKRIDAHAFRRAGGERRTAVVTGDRRGTQVRSGLADLVVMKTTKSAFEGFPRDRYTTLKETADRLLATSVEASWSYSHPPEDFGKAWQGVRRLLLDTFAAHDSRSVQHTLYAMGEAVVETLDVEEIHIAMPNLHHLPVDLAPFGLENRNEIFVATAEPYGLIEGTVRRGSPS